MQQLLISDSNVFMDLECCNLLDLMFALPYYFCAPDILFEQELRQQHSHLLTIGLQLLTLNANSMVYVYTLNEKYSNPSMNDLMALSLAKQENCPLLTGDKALRDAAQKEAVLIKGTVWVLEQLVIHQHIDKSIALTALQTMQNNHRRLPFEKARQIINEITI